MRSMRGITVALFFSATLPLLSQGTAKVDFKSQIAPVFEKNCVGCHGQGSHVNLTSRQELLAEKFITPGQPDKSPLYVAVAQGSMPPGQKLSAGDIQLIRSWIAAGAEWPADVSLKAPAPPAAGNSVSGGLQAGEMAEVQKIR